jgi:hypothetical protein
VTVGKKCFGEVSAATLVEANYLSKLLLQACGIRPRHVLFHLNLEEVR